MEPIGPTVIDQMRRLAPSQLELQDLERGLRAEAVDYLTEILRDHVRDDGRECLLRIRGMDREAFELVDAEEDRSPTGLRRKREWLTGMDARIVVEFVAAEQEESE